MCFLFDLLIIRRDTSAMRERRRRQSLVIFDFPCPFHRVRLPSESALERAV